MSTREVTVGIDIGTSSVKAVAADGDGNVVAHTRIPHPCLVDAPDRLEHDAAVAWRDGPRAALAALGDLPVRGVGVAAMVPSLAAVDAQGTPVSRGLLYGDVRGRPASGAFTGGEPGSGPDTASAGLPGFVAALAAAHPDAHGLWPAQAVANHALGGEAVLDSITAVMAHPLYDFVGWDEERVRALGARVDQLPRVVPTGWAAGRVGGAAGDGPALASGCVDAFAEQLVSGADAPGDVLVLLGTTLVMWVVVEHPVEVPGYLTVPHTASGCFIVGGPSNAGGLFRDWVDRLLAPVDAEDVEALDPGRVPVWAPYPRGERVPLDDPDRRAALAGLDLTHGAPAARRAADEASGFVVRRLLDALAAAGARDGGVATSPRRIVASGGGTRAPGLVRAIAETTGLPVDCVAVPDGAALGSAWLARIAAGLEEPTAMAEGRRWARPGRRVEPRTAWAAATAARYEQFLALGAP
jgi:xylulokinase